jgi:hypothetical protein
MGYDTKTDRLTDCQSQYDFDFDSVEADSNTSTLSLRVVGSNENGGLKSDTVKYGHEYHGTRN